MLYASTVWSLYSLGNLQRVLDTDTQEKSVELFKKLNWLPFYFEVKVNICIQVYKHINKHGLL